MPFRVTDKRLLRILQSQNLVHFKNGNNYNEYTANVLLKLCKLYLGLYLMFVCFLSSVSHYYARPGVRFSKDTETF